MKPSNKTLLWRESFAVGHPSLDGEHRQIVDLINAIGSTFCDESDVTLLIVLLRALHRVAGEHALHEEAIMREITSENTGPWRSRMAPRMKMMVGRIFAKHFQEHKVKGSALDAIIVGPLDELSDRLHSWFVEHVHGSDADLKALLQMVDRESLRRATLAPSGHNEHGCAGASTEQENAP
jgi:hemerythrin-like metal-binding protein